MERRRTKRIQVLYKILNKITDLYLSLIDKTCKMEFSHIDELKEKTVVCFFHGDSFLMNLLLEQEECRKNEVKVLVTADERGDAITHQIERNGSKALRMPDGLKMKPFFRDLMEESKKENILAVSLDGPLGPYQVPKKLAFVLAETGNRKILGVRIETSRQINLFWRWDHYRIMLPFTKISIQLEDLGYVQKEDLNSFSEYQKKVLSRLIPKLPSSQRKGGDRPSIFARWS